MLESNTANMHLSQSSDSGISRMRSFRIALYISLTIFVMVLFDSALHPTDTANWTSSADDDFDEFERILQFDDDDRHDSDPFSHDTSNGPTVLSYSKMPSSKPTTMPSPSPTSMPTSFPTSSPSAEPSLSPTSFPSGKPSAVPSSLPSRLPSLSPTGKPSAVPSSLPSSLPSLRPTGKSSGMPSSLPSSLPSLRPTGNPSSSPSLQPSKWPSSAPSSSPSLDPCKGYGGTFGNTSSPNEVTISFMYGVESDKKLMESMPLSDQIKEIEQLLLDLLIESFFYHCDLTSAGVSPRDVNVFAAGGKQVGPSPKATLSDVIGIKASPVDLANGIKCTREYIDVDSDCNAVNGQLTVYLSDMQHAINVTNRMKENIKDIMDKRLLDDCHEAVLRVLFMYSISTRAIPDDDYYEVETLTTIENRSVWMFAACGLAGLMAVAVGTRYRYASQFKDDGSGELRDNYEKEEDDTEDFVEVDSSTQDSILELAT